MNNYFTPPPDLAPGTKARSVDINAIGQAASAAFDKLPSELALKTGTANYVQNAGTVDNAYQVTLDPKITAYFDGLEVKLLPMRDNTGACTLNVNGLGNITIKRTDGTAPTPSDLQAASPITLVYVASTNTFRMPPLANGQVALTAASAAAAAQSVKDAAAQVQAASAQAGYAQGYAQSAYNSASASSSSANASAGSATGAAGSATAASNSATAAANSASAAAGSASAAQTSANNASTAGTAAGTAAAQAVVNGKAALAGNPAQNFAAADMAVSSMNGGPLAGLRNRLINGCMRIFQRGPAAIVIPPANDFFTLDRWHIYNGLDVSISVSQSTQPNYGGSDKLQRMRIVPLATPTIGGIYINQRVEDSSTFAGMTATMSAVVMTPEANMQCRFNATQMFGSGGSAGVVTYGQYSPASGVITGGPLATPIKSTWTLPSTAGKTIGTGDYLEACLELDPRTSNVISVTGVQLEAGSVATPFEQRPYGLELALCQRYYSTVVSPVAFCGNTTSGTAYYATYSLPAAMRALPTLTGSNQNGAGFPAVVGTLGVAADYKTIYESRVSSATTSAAIFGSQIYANAEL